MFPFWRDGKNDIKDVERRRVVTRTRHIRFIVFSNAQHSVQVDQFFGNGQGVFVVKVPEVPVAQDAPFWLERSFHARINEENPTVVLCTWLQAHWRSLHLWGSFLSSCTSNILIFLRFTRLKNSTTKSLHLEWIMNVRYADPLVWNQKSQNKNYFFPYFDTQHKKIHFLWCMESLYIEGWVYKSSKVTKSKICCINVFMILDHFIHQLNNEKNQFVPLEDSFPFGLFFPW